MGNARGKALFIGVEMIREILPNCGGQALEQALTTYRMWHCYDCGLEFSMKTLETAVACPRCLLKFEERPEELTSELFHCLEKLLNNQPLTALPAEQRAAIVNRAYDALERAKRLNLKA
jgi:hypothetical protein